MKTEREYTKQDLEQCSKEYRSNFKMMCNAVGTPDHVIYVKEEHRLNKLDKRIRKNLGIYLSDPCPIHISKHCYECTGKYERSTRFTLKGKQRNKFVESFSHRGRVCRFKDVKKLTEIKDQDILEKRLDKKH